MSPETSSPSPHPAGISARQMLVALAVSGLWMIVNLVPLRGIPYSADEAPGFDAHIYLAMAESPSVFTMPPHAYRIGVPLLAHLLPLPPEASFFLLTLLSLMAILTLTYVFLRQLGFDHGLALLGTSFVGAAPEVSVFLDNYFLVDPMTLALMMVLFIAIERGLSAGPTALLLLVASLFKEAALFAVPVLYIRLAGGWCIDRPALERVLLISAPAVAAALILRLGWGGELIGFPYLHPWTVPRQPWFGEMTPYRELWSGLFGYLSILAIANAFAISWREFALRYVAYLAIVVAQLIVPMNSERLLFYAFPFVIPLALAELQRMKVKLPDWYPLLFVLLFFCYLFTPEQILAPMAVVVLARVLMEWRRSKGKGE